MLLSQGSRIGGYRIIEAIGFGGVAIVYRAEQLALGREVALKVLNPAVGSDEPFRDRFRREGRIIARLEHPNVVPIFDFGEAQGRLFFAMRLLRGGTMADRIRQQSLGADEALGVLARIADALDAAHALGLVHRDVKPQNILLDDRGDPYLADFGIAKELLMRDVTVAGGFLGTYSYAAPEQILGQRVTGATDVYGLTAVLFQCFTGRLPYPRDSDASVCSAHVCEPPPTVGDSDAAGGVFNAVVAQGMAKRPDHRFHDARELVLAAQRAMSLMSPPQRTRSPPFSAAGPCVMPAGPVPGSARTDALSAQRLARCPHCGAHNRVGSATAVRCGHCNEMFRTPA